MLAAALDTSNLMSFRDQIVFMQLALSLPPCPQLLRLIIDKEFLRNTSASLPSPAPFLLGYYKTLSDPASDIQFTHMPN